MPRYFIGPHFNYDPNHNIVTCSTPATQLLSVKYVDYEKKKLNHFTNMWKPIGVVFFLNMHTFSAAASGWPLRSKHTHLKGLVFRATHTSSALSCEGYADNC